MWLLQTVKLSHQESVKSCMETLVINHSYVEKSQKEFSDLIARRKGRKEITLKELPYTALFH